MFSGSLVRLVEFKDMVVNSTKLPWMRDDRVILSLTIGAHNGDDVRNALANHLLSINDLDYRSLDASDMVKEAR